MVYLMSIALGIFCILYAVLTILPVVYLDCPCRTPMSIPLWSILQRTWISSFLPDSGASADASFTEAVMDHATQETGDRDKRALRWTLDSLTDDTELPPFIEAIPDAIHGPQGFRSTNLELFDHLLGDTLTPSPLVTRISNFLIGTEAMRPEDPLAVRRRAAGRKALWLLCIMPSADNRQFDFHSVETFSTQYLRRPARMDDNYEEAAHVGIRYHILAWSFHLHSTLCDLLHAWDMDSIDSNLKVVPQIRLYWGMIQRFNLFFHPAGIIEPTRRLLTLGDEITDLTPPLPYSTLKDVRLNVKNHLQSPLWNLHKAEIVTRFVQGALHNFANGKRDLALELLHSAQLILPRISASSIPDQFRAIFYPPLTLGFSAVMPVLGRNRSLPELDSCARIAFRIFPFLLPQEQTGHFFYLTRRRNAFAVREVLAGCDLLEMARLIGNYLQREHDDPTDPTHFSQAVHAAVVLALQDSSDTILFVSQLMLGRMFPLPLELADAQYIHHSSNVYVHLQMISLADPDARAQVQYFCEDSICRLTLPRNENLNEVMSLLRLQLFEGYLRSIAQLLENFFAPLCLEIEIFDRPMMSPSRWGEVEPRSRKLFFNAILQFHTRLESLYADSDGDLYLKKCSLEVAEQLWSSQLFSIPTRNDFGPAGSCMEEIEPVFLRTLMDALELYHKVVESVGEVGYTEDSRKLAEEVLKQLRREGESLDISKNVGEAGDTANGTSERGCPLTG